MRIDPATIEKPKKSLGYAVTFSTASPRPVTGREWVYTATDDQLKVLYGIERMWAGIQAKKYQYVFREIHNADGFDGWTIILRNKETGSVHWKRFEGFPGSVASVLQSLHLLYEQTETA